MHRQEEEGKRRKNFKQGYRGGLNPLDEDEDAEFEGESVSYDPNQQHIPAKLPRSSNADVSSMEKQMRNTTLSHAAQARQQQQPQQAPKQEGKGYGQHSAAVAAAARKQVKTKGPFELSLDNATLLGRRGKKGPGLSGLREQAV